MDSTRRFATYTNLDLTVTPAMVGNDVVQDEYGGVGHWGAHWGVPLAGERD